MTARSSAGFTLIEVLITLAVLVLLIFVGLPGMSTWLQNTQIRGTAEAMQGGLQLARAEALRRNGSVRFQLVNTLAAGCALSPSGANWVISLAELNGACDAVESDEAGPGLPRILQKRNGAEGGGNTVVAATGVVPTVGASSIVFSGLGRVIQAPPATEPPIMQIDISKPPEAGTCQAAGGRLRCLRLNVSSGGQVRMCDPAVTAVPDPADPRRC